MAAQLSGRPYDLFDATELRGNPQLYPEKAIGRFHYGQLSAHGVENVLWQAALGSPVLMVDEGNLISPELQAAILQGIETGRWNYGNESLSTGKLPTLITMNHDTGALQNGFIPALKDRLDFVTEHGFFTTIEVFDYADAKKAVKQELCNREYVNNALDKLVRSFDEYRNALKHRPISGHLTSDEKQAIQEEIRSLKFDNDGMRFIQAFMAELNFSQRYGSKRGSDPSSDDTHDKNYAGVHVRHSFSPRSVMAALDYAKALAWFLNEKPGLDHVRFVLPHIIAHKAKFTEDFKNEHGNDHRTEYEDLHLARCLVGDVFGRYTTSILPVTNFISLLGDWEDPDTRRTLKPEYESDETTRELLKQLMQAEKDGTPIREIPLLQDSQYDHPLMKDVVRTAREMEDVAFYGEDGE